MLSAHEEFLLSVDIPRLAGDFFETRTTPQVS
jgi:hypothetical protein